MGNKTIDKFKGRILIDTILYNPTRFVFNIDIANGIGFLYDSVADCVIPGEIVRVNGETVLKCIHPHDKRKRIYNYIDFMFDINEKRWLHG